MKNKKKKLPQIPDPRRCALGGADRSGEEERTRWPSEWSAAAESGPLNEPTSGGGSGESVTGGVTDQPTLRWEKCLGQHLQ